MSGEQKWKEGDGLAQAVEGSNTSQLLFFTNHFRVYKASASTFDDSKASLLGDYIPAKLGFEEDENVIKMVVTKDYSGMLLFVFDNGKVAKVPLSGYETKTHRKRLLHAYCDKSPLIAVFHLKEETEMMLLSDAGRLLLLDTKVITIKASHDTQGITCMKWRGKHKVTGAELYTEGKLQNPARYRAKEIPSIGAILKEEGGIGEQLHF